MGACSSTTSRRSPNWGAGDWPALGYEVTTLNDATLALQRLRASPDAFDLVVTDFLMPKLSGLDLAREIAEIRPGLGIVLLTGHMEEFQPEQLAAAGVRAVVKKPLTLPDLGKGAGALPSGRTRTGLPRQFLPELRPRCRG